MLLVQFDLLLIHVRHFEMINHRLSAMKEGKNLVTHNKTRNLLWLHTSPGKLTVIDLIRF